MQRLNVKAVALIWQDPEELRAVLPEAEHIARSQIFLMLAGRKEGVEVSEEEVDAQLQQITVRAGQEFDAVKDHYVRNGLIFNLRDRLVQTKLWMLCTLRLL